MNYEQEEEFLTNDLSRKLAQVQLTTETLRHLNSLMPPPSHKDSLVTPERFLGCTMDLEEANEMFLSYDHAGQ